MESTHLILAREFVSRANRLLDLAYGARHRPSLYEKYLEYTKNNLEKALAKVNTDLEMIRIKLEYSRLRNWVQRR